MRTMTETQTHTNVKQNKHTHLLTIKTEYLLCDHQADVAHFGGQYLWVTVRPSIFFTLIFFLVLLFVLIVMEINKLVDG